MGNDMKYLKWFLTVISTITVIMMGSLAVGKVIGKLVSLYTDEHIYGEITHMIVFLFLMNIVSVKFKKLDEL